MEELFFNVNALNLSHINTARSPKLKNKVTDTRRTKIMHITSIEREQGQHN